MFLRTARAGTAAFLFVLAAELLFPASAFSIADLMVLPDAFDPVAQTGGEFLLQFSVMNLGPDPTSISGISNYVFIWDPALNEPIAQLSPVPGHTAHIWHAMGPGEIVQVGPFPVTIPWDTPLDTMITMAIATDWLDYENEVDEMNNIALFDVPVEPLDLFLDPIGVDLCDSLGEPGILHHFQFQGVPGQMVFAETEGANLQSVLALYHPSSGSDLASDGAISEIGERSRIDYIDLPFPDAYRLDLGGRNLTGGSYCLHLQEGLPEMEPNDDLGSANEVLVGAVMYGTLDVPGDADFYTLFGAEGEIVTIDVDADEALETNPDSVLDPQIVFFGPAGEALAIDDDTYEYDPSYSFVISDTNGHSFKIEDPPGDGQGFGFPEYNYVFRLRDDGPATQDLQAMSVTPIGEPWYMDCPMQLDFSVTNAGGNRTYAGGVSVTVVLSVDGVIDPLDTLLAAADFEGDLQAGETSDQTVFVTLPPEWTVPAAYVGIVVDPTESEWETDETNNALLVPITIDPSQIGTGMDGGAPFVNALDPNRPNPFNPTTSIRFSIESRSRVVLKVFDTAGRAVRSLVDTDLPAGAHTAYWDGRNGSGQKVSSGIYLYTLEAGAFRSTKKMALLR